MGQQVKAGIETLNLAPLIQVEKENAVDEHNNDVSPTKKRREGSKRRRNWTPSGKRAFIALSLQLCFRSL